MASRAATTAVRGTVGVPVGPVVEGSAAEAAGTVSTGAALAPAGGIAAPWLGIGMVGAGVGSGAVRGAGGRAGVTGAAAVVVLDTGRAGWIEMYRPSQIIRLGAYHHFVKNRLNWLTVSRVFGRMS
jgi:hypothetical protein